ncbi:MAG: hypothetical protein RL522_1036 [Pseudomonadota bacterium]|jgi:hypothetical protein
MHRYPTLPAAKRILAACLLTLSSLALAQTVGGTTASEGEAGMDNSGDYQKEMQACREGHTGQDRATCMHEARQARKAKRRGALQTPSAQAQEANAMARCEGMNQADMAACRARMMGYGQTSGSVAGGGVLRELEVVEMEAGQESVNVAPKGDAPVLVVPAPKQP